MTPQEAFQKAQPGFLAYREGRFEDAAAVATQILLLAPHDPNGLYLKGIALRALAEPEEALGFLQAAARIAPGQLAFETAIAQTLGDLERYDEARAQFDFVAGAHPNAFEPVYHRALMEYRAGDLYAAEQGFIRALEMRPGDFETILQLANLARDVGHWERLSERAEAALALAPQDIRAITLRAEVDLRLGAPDKAVDRLTPALKSEAGEPARRAAAWRLFGEAHDALGDPKAAISSWRAANEMLYSLHRAEYADRPDPLSLTAIRSVRAAFEAMTPRPLDDHKGPSPVFLVGFSHSGVALARRALSAHGAVRVGDRAGLLDAAIAEAGSDAKRLTAFMDRDPSSLDALRETCWTAAGGAPAPGEVFIDPAPLTLARIGVAAKLFPGARFILVLRDPRDDVFAAWRRPATIDAARFRMLRVEDAAAYYDAAMGAGQAARRIYRDLPVCELRHEDLVEDAPAAMRDLADFLGLALESAEPDGRDDAMGDVAVDRDPVGRWRHYDSVLEPVRADLDRWAKRWGYPV